MTCDVRECGKAAEAVLQLRGARGPGDIVELGLCQEHHTETASAEWLWTSEDTPSEIIMGDDLVARNTVLVSEVSGPPTYLGNEVEQPTSLRFRGRVLGSDVQAEITLLIPPDLYRAAFPSRSST